MVGPCSNHIHERGDKVESAENFAKSSDKTGKHKHHKVSKAEQKARSTFPKSWKMPERELALSEARERVENP
jgi:hypothetical protein